MTEESTPTQWHRLLGTMYEELFAGFEVEVYTDFKLMSDPPRADIIIIRRRGPHWSEAEQDRLPDGVRHSEAGHILFEFKYTESLTETVLEKAHGYDIFYRDNQNLSPEQVATFVLSARTPRQTLLAAYGYEPAQWPGVYRSEQPMVSRVGLLVLNDLADETHNSFIKCFASRPAAKEKAFSTLGELAVEALPGRLWSFLIGLRRYWFREGGFMSEELTPEKIFEEGRRFQEALLANLTVEERLQGLKPEERLQGLKPEERLQGLKPEEVLSRYKPEEVLSRYKPEERLAGLEPYLAEQQRQAEQQAMGRTLGRQLRARFGLPAETLTPLQERLQQLDLASLEQLSEAVVQVESLAEFEQRLSQVEAAD